MGDDRRRLAELAHRAAESADTTAANPSRRGYLLVSAHMLRSRAGIDDVAHRTRRSWRRDDSVEVGARPARQARAVRAEATVRRWRADRRLGQLGKRRQHLVGHRRRARVDDRDAVPAHRCRDVGAVGDQHVDVPLHRQHVDLPVARTLIGNALRHVVGRLRDRDGEGVERGALADDTAVLGIDRLHPAAHRLERNPGLRLEELADAAVLSRKEVRHPVPIAAAVLRKRRPGAVLRHRAGSGIVGVGDRQDVRLVEIDRVVHDLHDREHVVVPGDELRHRQHVGGLRPAPLQVPVLQVRRRDLERLTDPLAGREPAPAVRRPGRRVRPAVHEDRPVERAHELHPVADDLPGNRVQVLEDARAADASPLVRGGMRPALVFRGAPDRLRRRVGAKAAGFVQRQPEVVRQWRLARVLGAVEPPFTGDIRRPRALGADPKVEHRGGGSGDDEQEGR